MFYGISFAELSQAIQATREEMVEAIKDHNLTYMESCEPDCTPERHAYHEGSWNHYTKMEEYLDSLTNKSEK